MKELVEQLRNERKQAEAKAKTLEEKSDPVPRERQYAYAKGLYRAIQLIEEMEENPQTVIKSIQIWMRDKTEDFENWGLFHSVTIGKEFDFSWLNPQKLVDSFVFKVEVKE